MFLPQKEETSNQIQGHKVANSIFLCTNSANSPLGDFFLSALNVLDSYTR